MLNTWLFYSVAWAAQIASFESKYIWKIGPQNVLHDNSLSTPAYEVNTVPNFQTPLN